MIMEITDIVVYTVNEEKLKAYITLTFDNCFVVRDLKVIKAQKGYFVAMPNKKRKDGVIRDIAHPLNQDMRDYIETKVLEKYRETVGDSIESEEVVQRRPIVAA
jgi:stage V sporulation protein G